FGFLRCAFGAGSGSKNLTLGKMRPWAAAVKRDAISGRARPPLASRSLRGGRAGTPARPLDRPRPPPGPATEPALLLDPLWFDSGQRGRLPWAQMACSVLKSRNFGIRMGL